MNRLQLRNDEMREIFGDENWLKWGLIQTKRNVEGLQDTAKMTLDLLKVLKKIKKCQLVKVEVDTVNYSSELYISIRRNDKEGIINIYNNVKQTNLEGLIEEAKTFLKKIESEIRYWTEPLCLYYRNEKGQIKKL